MKKIFFALLFSIFPTLASAQIIRVEAICLEKKLIDDIVEKTKEQIVWVGTIKRDDSEVGTASLYMNIKTGSWSYVEHWKDISCVVAGGDYSRLREILKGNPT